MMSSPPHVAGEAQASTPGVTPQSQIAESTIGVPPTGSLHQVVASLTSVSPVCQSATEVVASITSLPCAFNVPSMAVTVSVTPAASPSMPKVASCGIANEPFQESGQAKFLTSPGFVVPTPPLPCNVLPLVNSASGSTQQSLPSPALKLLPSVSAPTLQPPVPGQMLGYRPSFSYNITSHANSSSSTGQQIQPTIGSGHLQGGRFAPTMNAASLQPPVPGQLVRSTSSVSEMISPNISQMRMPPPIPRGSVPTLGTVPAPTNFAFSGSSRLAAVSGKTLSSNINKSDTVSADTGTSSAASNSSQSTQSSTALPSSSAMPLTASPGMNSTSMLLPTALPSPVHSGISVVAAKPGQLGMPSSASFSPNGTTAPIGMGSSLSLGKAMPAPVSASTNHVPVSVPQNIQQQVYAPHASVPVMGPPPQAPWLHHSQHGGVQRAPFPTFPGGFPAAIPIRGMPLPSVPLQPVQPPGVSNAAIHGGSFPIISSFSDAGSNLVTKSPFPDIDRLANDLSKDGGDLKNEQADEWTAHNTETGVIYYYNSHTGQSTYERPLNFKGEPEKVDGQPTPVSWEKLDGTDWSLVMTNDGKKYYYDTKNKVSSWELPPEVAELRRNQDIDPAKGNPAQMQNASLMSDKVSAPVSLSAPALQTGGRESTVLRTSAVPASSSALDLIKKKLQDAGMPAACSPLPASSVPTTSDLNGSRVVEAAVKGSQSTNSKDKVRDANGDGNVSDSSSDSDDAESGPSKEECIIQFKEMLKERGVAPFSKWDKELPKIVFDPRFKAVPGYSTRRALFEQFVRTRAEEVRREERAAQKAAIDGFRQLLEEASEDIDHRTDYEAFKRKWGNDLRFMALKRKEQEFLLNEKILPLKKAAEDKRQAIRSAAVSSFKSMLREREDITPNSRWSRVKESLRNDPRYKSVKHEDREVLFNEYVSELKAAKEELEKAAKSKKDEQEKLKDRERELRKRKEREEQEMERVRLKIRKKEAVASYQALLVETIKDPKATWTESKPKLEKDPQGRATNPDLAQADAEKLFRERVKDLFERCVRDFRTLLFQVITPEAAAQTGEDGKTILNSWSEAKRLLKPDPRYSKIPGKEREALWSRHAEDLLRKQKATSSDQKEQQQEGEGKIRSSTDYSRRSPRRSHGRR